MKKFNSEKVALVVFTTIFALLCVAFVTVIVLACMGVMGGSVDSSTTNTIINNTNTIVRSTLLK